MSDEQIKAVLRQAFIAVEKGFFQSLDDALAEKTELQLQLPEVRSKIIITTYSIPANLSCSIMYVTLMTSEHYQRHEMFAS